MVLNVEEGISWENINLGSCSNDNSAVSFFFTRTDSEDWKEFISKPSLPYALRLLTGLSGGHTGIQQQIGKDIIPVLHKLEQVSSDEHIGTMAENLMEALKENQQVKARVSGRKPQ